MSEKYDPVGMAKAMAWERAKGELASIVAAEGSRYSDRPGERGLFKFQEIEQAIEAFVKDFEEQEFNL